MKKILCFILIYVNVNSPGDIKEKIYVSRARLSREEYNVLMLDSCEFSLDGGEFEAEEEILRIDNICRRRLNIPKRTDVTAQPWVVPDEEPCHSITLRTKINSQSDFDGAFLAIEKPEDAKIWFNDEELSLEVVGYFTDKSIKTVKLPKIKKGENILIVKLPFAERTNLEWLYVLGEFDVKLVGTYKKIVPIDEEKGFGSVVNMGMPFYGGSLDYECDFETLVDGDAYISVGTFRGPVIRAFVDGEDAGVIAIQPYKVKVANLKKGKHTLKFKLYGNRCNCFNSLHNINPDDYWNGAIRWNTEDGHWSYEYNLKDFGILHSPMIEIR